MSFANIIHVIQISWWEWRKNTGLKKWKVLGKRRKEGVDALRIHCRFGTWNRQHHILVLPRNTSVYILSMRTRKDSAPRSTRRGRKGNRRSREDFFLLLLYRIPEEEDEVVGGRFFLPSLWVWVTKCEMWCVNTWKLHNFSIWQDFHTHPRRKRPFIYL